MAERIFRDKEWYKKIPKVIKWFFTICAVYFLWILFSAGGASTALETYLLMFKTNSRDVNFSWKYYLTNRTLLFLSIALIGHVFGIEPIRAKMEAMITTKIGIALKRVLLIFLFLIDIFYVVNSTYSPFMYFQF